MTTIATIPVSSLRRAPAPSTELKAPLHREDAGVPSLYELPLMDLLCRAQQSHRENFDANEVQLFTPLSIKTGGCVRSLGLETGMTLGMLQPEHAQALKEAGLDHYNHDPDTSPGFHGDKLLATSNPQADRDRQLFARLGLKVQGARPAVHTARRP